MAIRIFKAEVNGKTRSVTLDMPRGYASDVAEAEMMVMNNEYLYSRFYRGLPKDHADYDAELVNPRLVRPR